MTLCLIGLGLSDEKDISVKGLEIVQKADVVYVERYTSLLQCGKDDLEKMYGRRVILADRTISEQEAEKIVAEAKHKSVAFLVVGDPFSATTHIGLFKLARENSVKVMVVHNASVLTAVGVTGLQLYKFGRTASLPFPKDVPHLETPYTILRQNYYLGLHSLFLLDLKPEQNEFLTIFQALRILQNIEAEKREGVIKKNMLVVGCARLGSDTQLIKAGELEKIQKMEFGKPPFCLIIPGKLHFMEEEMLKLWN